MIDLIRNQNLARLQGMQQQFPLGGQQVNIMGGGPGNNQPHIQNQPFLDSGSVPSQASGFPSGMPNSSIQQQQQSPANRNPMMQVLQANNGHARQLEILLAQNPPGQINLAQRLEHQRAVQQQAQQLQNLGQSSPAELFASGAVDRRSSPGHPGPNPIGSGVNTQQQQQQQPRRISLAELNDRIMSLRTYIANQERTLAQVGSQRNLASDGQALVRMRGLSEDIKVKKDYLAKMVSAMNNFTAMTQAQAQQATGSGQSLWNFNGSSQMTSGQPPNTQQVGHTGIPQGHSSPLIRQQAQQLQQINRSTGLTSVVPRPPSAQRSHPPNSTGAIGAQGPGSSLANQLSPSMNPQFPFPMNSVNGPASSPLTGPMGLQSSHVPPPLEKSRFDKSYKDFCATKGVKHDPRMMNYEGRDIDLYILHTHVMQEGGPAKVNAQDLWGVIGGRMGFVHFPASETEPAKAGPGFAQQLAQVYQDYLAHFDQAYMNSIMDSKRKLHLHQAQLAQTQAAAAAAAVGNTNNALTSNQTARGALNGNQMQMVVGYAHQSVEELRRQGVQERIISFVESNRAYLQRTAMEQGIFRGQLSQGMRPPEQLGTPAMVPPFQNGSHQNASSQHAGFLPQSNGLSTTISGNNFVDNRQSSGPQLQHQNMQNGNVAVQPKNVAEIAEKIKSESKAHVMRNTRLVDVPMEQRAEFNHILNQISGLAQEIEKQLPNYLFVLKLEDIKKLALITSTVTQQRTLLNHANPRYMVTLEILRTMMQHIQQATERMNGHLRQHMGPSLQQTHLHPAGNIPLNNLPGQEMPRPPSLPQSVPPQLAPANRPPMNVRLPPVVKKPSGSTPGAVSTPTPPYSASTPVASASTPTQTTSSPPASKSPKGKAPPRPKKRRPSVKRPLSTPVPLAIEQESTPPGISGASSKRLREEDAINPHEASPGASGTCVTNEPSPPKRPKMEGEWGGPVNEALTKKVETVENIKTEEDTTAFLEQMTELIKMAGEGQQEALSSDISETLDQILKGYSGVPDGSDPLHGLSSFGSLGELSSQASSSKPHPDEFVEFFDFSSFTAADEENDTDSKAPTPELSSTGPSPDSGSEADAAQHVLLPMEPPTKTEELPDLLRIGSWKEIDGGESAYYHTADGWKWDSPMPSLEQPWAIFNS